MDRKQAQAYRNACTGGGVTHGQHGEVLGPVQPSDRGLGLTDPLHHGHIMLPMQTSAARLEQESTSMIRKQSFFRGGTGSPEFQRLGRHQLQRVRRPVKVDDIKLHHRVDLTSLGVK